MPLFQTAVLNKYLKLQDKTLVDKQYIIYKNYFLNATIQQTILQSKEEEYQDGFLRALFVDVLGYTLKPAVGFNLVRELKNVNDAKKADGAIVDNENVLAVIELKGTDTINLQQIETQAFNYKNNQANCKYVVTSNFQKLRFYIDNAIDSIEWNLFQLDATQFALLYLCLHKDNIFIDLPATIKTESVTVEDNITKQLYKEYSQFRKSLFNNIVAQNADINKLLLFKKTQKLLDRFLFLFFAEDRQLVPPNSVREILKQWDALKDMDAYQPLYNRFKLYFGYLNTGHKGKLHDIFAYNGGLFAPDEILDAILIDDAILYQATLSLSNYDYNSEVDVNILGHIFEHSLTEIEELERAITAPEDTSLNPSKGGTSKRKKDGVFYTPKYITKYIVENTVGTLCKNKKVELQLQEEDYHKLTKKAKKQLYDNLMQYREWLLHITIVDPACGSGAFLNQALEFLIAEHRWLAELESNIFNAPIVFDVESSILENNLFGVDINEESVEIAKLSLWLRTASKGRKLNSLNNNIKCGNSLIDDVAVAGDKAFNWQNEFPKIFEKGGFDVVIGNPPYGAALSNDDIIYYRNNYSTVIGHSEIYYLFIEQGIKKLLKQNCLIGYIIPNSWLSNKYAKKIRELLIDETNILVLINFNRKIIFEEANVETSIFISRNNFKIENENTFVGQDTDNLYFYNQDEWRNNQNYLMSFAPNPQIDNIVKKLNSSEYKFSDKLDISNGFKPYQVGYGLNLEGKPLGSEDVENRIYHSAKYEGKNYKKELKGKGLNRYTLKWEENYINWGKWLMSPKSVHYFEEPKILIRQVISDYFFAYLDFEKYFADQSLYVCTNFQGKKENLEFYLCLINSKLYGFYFRKFYSEEDDLFPKIKVNELKNLPVKNVTNKDQQPFIEQAEIMLSKNKELQQANAQFQGLLISKFDGININTKLDKWYSLSFADFCKELTKQKIKLTLNEQSEWLQFFEQEKQKALSIKQTIDATDNAIDKMVYALYGLTDEEIKIVEGN